MDTTYTYVCSNCGKTIKSSYAPEKCSKCGGQTFTMKVKKK